MIGPLGWHEVPDPTLFFTFPSGPITLASPDTDESLARPNLESTFID